MRFYVFLFWFLLRFAWASQSSLLVLRGLCGLGGLLHGVGKAVMAVTATAAPAQVEVAAAAAQVITVLSHSGHSRCCACSCWYDEGDEGEGSRGGGLSQDLDIILPSNIDYLVVQPDVVTSSPPMGLVPTWCTEDWLRWLEQFDERQKASF